MNLLTVETGVVLFGVFVLGTVIGSMLNVCIHRLPLEERFWPALRSLWYPPSHCPRCKTPIAPYDNIPILGWLFLRGRCRNCQKRISFRYPAIELLTGLLFVAVCWSEIPSFGSWAQIADGGLAHEYGPQLVLAGGWLAPWWAVYLRFALHLLLVIALIVATFIDVDLRVIPDTVTLPAMAAALLAQAGLGGMFVVPVWYQTPAMLSAFPTEVRHYMTAHGTSSAEIPSWLSAWWSFSGIPGWITAHPHLHGLLVSVAGIVVGGGIVWGVRLVGQWVLKREAMGFGDVVLLAMIGSFLGWQATLIVFFIAPVCALVFTAAGWFIWRNREIPYGPYLSLATLILLIFWKPIWPWFEVRVFTLGPFLPVAALGMFTALGGLLYIVRTVQKLLGISYTEEPEWIAEWTPGDQLVYLAGERVDDRQGQWPAPRWPGELSGRGLGQVQQWRGR